MRRAKEYDMNEKSSKETKKHGSLGGGGGVPHFYTYQQYAYEITGPMTNRALILWVHRTR